MKRTFLKSIIILAMGTAFIGCEDSKEETELKKNLLIKKEFKGLQDTIIFDQYGDVIRRFNTFKVINGKFEKVE